MQSVYRPIAAALLVMLAANSVSATVQSLCNANAPDDPLVVERDGELIYQGPWPEAVVIGLSRSTVENTAGYVARSSEQVQQGGVVEHSANGATVFAVVDPASGGVLVEGHGSTRLLVLNTQARSASSNQLSLAGPSVFVTVVRAATQWFTLSASDGRAGDLDGRRDLQLTIDLGEALDASSQEQLVEPGADDLVVAINQRTLEVTVLCRVGASS